MIVGTARATKARKAHRCSWCGGRIEKGDVYRRQTDVGDGGVRTLDMCRRCEGYVREMAHSGYYDSADPETFEEFMWEFHPSRALSWWTRAYAPMASVKSPKLPGTPEPPKVVY